MRGVPETMRAAAIERSGGPEVLELRTLPVPEIDAGEVLIATHTAGVGSSFANPKGRFYAEYVAVVAEKVAPVPKPLGLREAGAVPTTGLTALQGIEHLGVRKGEAVIVHGASGGVGTLALQFAKLRGARVLATASGRDGVALVRRLGADLAVDGKAVEAAKPRIVIAASYPLAQARKAHERIEKGHVLGKIVLRIR
jgi:NADPH:quinone reductase-like Zn-dependent oxidoreductase